MIALLGLLGLAMAATALIPDGHPDHSDRSSEGTEDADSLTGGTGDWLTGGTTLLADGVRVARFPGLSGLDLAAVAHVAG